MLRRKIEKMQNLRINYGIFWLLLYFCGRKSICLMRYSKLTIAGVPKSFKIWDTVDYVQDVSEDVSLDDVQYDFYSLECDEEKGEEACVLFKYDESATGVFVTHTPHLQTLSIELSPWAVETDVLLYALFVNAFLARHKRARLYDKYAPLKSLTDDDVQKMIEERKKYLKRLLTTKDGFTMEGINADSNHMIQVQCLLLAEAYKHESDSFFSLS